MKDEPSRLHFGQLATLFADIDDELSNIIEEENQPATVADLRRRIGIMKRTLDATKLTGVNL